MRVNVPLGADSSPMLSLPQQLIVVLSRLNPHEWWKPAVTSLKTPLGALVWPSPFQPQQAAVPSVRRAHVWLRVESSWENVPDGGVALPKSFLPQHASDPSV